MLLPLAHAVARTPTTTMTGQALRGVIVPLLSGARVRHTGRADDTRHMVHRRDRAPGARLHVCDSRSRGRMLRTWCLPEPLHILPPTCRAPSTRVVDVTTYGIRFERPRDHPASHALARNRARSRVRAHPALR